MRRRSRDGFRRPCGRGRLRRNNSNAARRGRRGLRPLLNSAAMRNDIFTATYSLGCRVERDAPCYRVRPPPHRTVRAVFPHTALRVGLVSSVSLPFAPRLRFTLIPMDAPPYGRAVSDAPPHSGLSPIAVFRHYYSRHLIYIVPFTRRGPSHPQASPRFTCIIAYPFV